MKKSKLSIGLVTSFIGALALTSCNESASVTKSKDSVVDIIGYNSEKEKIEINVDELYAEYGDSKAGTTLYYNAILEALIRYEYPLISERDSDLKAYSRIESEADDKVKALQQTAKDNANSNGTKYEDEWDKILESNDVESKKELKLKFIYQLEKEAMSDWYFKKHSENSDNQIGLRQEYLGVDADWDEVDPATENVDAVYPYHILHILVKLSADATDYTRATISEAESKKLWQVMQQLIDGQYTFEDTAILSDDSSNTNFGDVGLMTTKTDFYNEFKLGVYAFDSILSGVNSESAATKGRYKAFGLDADATVVTQTTVEGGEDEEYVQDLIESEMVDKVNIHMEDAQVSIPAIPFDVFRQIGLKAEDTKIGTFEPEGNSASLPRNVLFNAFLNFRSPFVITNELLDESSVSATDSKIATSSYEFDDASILKLQSNNFQADKVSGLNKKVLCDTHGNVIIGVRSTAGIHFMVMRKSVFKDTNVAVAKQGTSLSDYYTTKIPTDEGYPTGKETYVNLKYSNDGSYYTERANTIKDDIKSSNFDAAYDYRIYETLLDQVFTPDGKSVGERIHFSDEDEQGNSVIRDNIDKTIALLRETAHYSQQDKINKAWQEYLLQLINQNNLRSELDMFEGAFVPTTCAFSFTKGNEALWEKEGLCYVK